MKILLTVSFLILAYCVYIDAKGLELQNTLKKAQLITSMKFIYDECEPGFNFDYDKAKYEFPLPPDTIIDILKRERK